MKNCSLKDRTALVIGGTSGAGLAVVKMLLEQECHVYAVGRHVPQMDENIKLNAEYITFDIEREALSTNLLTSHSRIGPALASCDILIVAFGPFCQKLFHETSAADWQRMALYDYALPGALASAALPSMIARSWGRVVFFGGTRTESVKDYRTNASYAGAKTGVSVLVKSIAANYAQHGITCNAVLPGFIHGAPQETSDVSEDFIASSVLGFLEHDELNGVLLNADRGWSPCAVRQ